MKELTDDTKLYRIMPMEQFLCMLQLKRNILVRPSLWEDPFEELINKTKVALSLEGKNEKIEVALNWQNWYCQSWSTQEENDAMWRSFSKNGEIRSVKIRTTKKKLENTIEPSYEKDVKTCNKEPFIQRLQAEKVHYCKVEEYENKFVELYNKICKGDTKSTDNILKNIEKSLLLIKRNEFAHENEVRLLGETLCLMRNGNSINYNIESSLNNGLIEEVVFDPWTPKHITKLYKEVILSYGFVKKENINISELYKKLDVNSEIEYQFTENDNIKNIGREGSNVYVVTKNGEKKYIKIEPIKSMGMNISLN